MKMDWPTLTATLSFEGTAVYVFGWLINTTTAQPTPKSLNLTFFLDGDEVGKYARSEDTLLSVSQYHVPFLALDGLDATSHNLTLLVTFPSLCLLDYFVYT